MTSFDSTIVFQALRNSSTINKLGSFDHGPGHWARVWENGVRLAEKTNGCDLVVVEFFALFHDTMRENEFDDPDHGERGYILANELGVDRVLNAEQWEDFYFACREHDRGLTTKNPTIGVCWDADRLDLPRVGITPAKRFLSTAAAKEEVDN